MFFEKLNFYFSKKAKLVTLCHHLGKARVNRGSFPVVHATLPGFIFPDGIFLGDSADGRNYTLAMSS